MFIIVDDQLIRETHPRFGVGNAVLLVWHGRAPARLNTGHFLKILMRHCKNVSLIMYRKTHLGKEDIYLKRKWSREQTTNTRVGFTMVSDTRNVFSQGYKWVKVNSWQGCWFSCSEQTTGPNSGVVCCYSSYDQSRQIIDPVYVIYILLGYHQCKHHFLPMSCWNERERERERERTYWHNQVNHVQSHWVLALEDLIIISRWKQD